MQAYYSAVGVTSVLMDQQHGTSRERKRKFTAVYLTALESTQVTSKVHNEAVETGCICGSQYDQFFFKSIVENTIRLKAQEIYGHVTQSQGNVQPFSASVLLYRKYI